jgi:hypothetical protein
MKTCELLKRANELGELSQPETHPDGIRRTLWVEPPPGMGPNSASITITGRDDAETLRGLIQVAEILEEMK